MRKNFRRTRSNNNKIVRLRNKEIWDVVKHVSWQTGVSHQIVFEALMDMFADGYLFGGSTSHVLFQKVIRMVNNE